MNLTRRQVALSLLIGSGSMLLRNASADTGYPEKLVRIVYGYPPGGAGDALSRLIGRYLAEELKQPVIIENKPGASGFIGNQFVAKSAPDGYTLLITPTQLVQAPGLYKKMPYDVVNDFSPIGQIATARTIFVTTDKNISSMADYVAKAVREPNKFSYGSYGAGSTPHIWGGYFNKSNGIQAVHVPYKGTGPQMQDMLGGRLSTSFIDLASALPFLKNGKMKALAIIGASRSPELPDVPTFAELGYDGMMAEAWYGMFAPAGLPLDIKGKLQKALERVLHNDDVHKGIVKMGLVPTSKENKEFSSKVVEDLQTWSRLVRAANISID